MGHRCMSLSFLPREQRAAKSWANDVTKANEQEVASARFRDCREGVCIKAASSGFAAAKHNRNSLGSSEDGCWLGYVGQNTPQSEHASLQLSDVFIPGLGMRLGQQWAQERGRCRHRCPAAKSGGRATGAIASSLSTMLDVQKGQRFPAKYQL